MQKITPEEYQKRLDRITEMFANMVTHADEQSNLRCPYRNRHDECTAKIRCRNQLSPRGGSPSLEEGGLLVCGHDGTFDYRDAWDSDPRSVKKARDKVQRIRNEASERRKTDD